MRPRAERPRARHLFGDVVGALQLQELARASENPADRGSAGSAGPGRECGREPNAPELGIFSVMWSEHCSYKSSRVHLKTLPTGGPQVLQGPGENAGASRTPPSSASFR